MANGKSGRKIKALIFIVGILIIAYVLGINVKDIIPSIFSEESQEEVTTSTQGSSEKDYVIQEVEGKLTLHMIDVGQADSFLLVQDGKTALVDCGTRSSGKDVVEYLKKLGINKIDYLFGTHPHDDHMGGMYDVITNFEISKIIIPEVENGKVTSNWYMKLMNEISSGEYEVEYAEVGAIYNLGEATAKVIGPISKEHDNINNYSTVLKVSFGEMDIIMAGDAEKEIEKEILESGEYIDAEILKSGHHGSDTSNSEEFIDAITPEYVLISAGVGNRYSHPIKSIMQEFEERNIEVYRTDESGTVIITITSEDINFDCNPGDYLSGEELEERNAK